MSQTRRGRAVPAVIFSAVMACGIVGCGSDPIAFDPRESWRREIAADPEIRSQKKPDLPTTARSDEDPTTVPADPEGLRPNVIEGKPVPMSLQEMIHLAVVNNLDVRVAAYDTAIDQTRIIEAEGAFDPNFFSDYTFQRIDKATIGTEITLPNLARPNTNNASSAFPGPIVIARRDQEAISTFDIGFSQNTSTGAQLKIEQEISNNWFNPPRGLLNPYFEDDLILTATQPLLKNFGTQVNTARIDIARNNSRISLMDFRKTLEDTVLKVEQDYWQLVEYNQDIATLERLVAVSEETVRVLQQRIVDATAIPISQAQAELASRKLQLIQVRQKAYDISDELKQLIQDPRHPVSGSGVLVPVDSPLEVQLQFNVDDEIETAMRNRFDLGQQMVRIESARIAHYVAQNNLLPTLDLTGSFTVDGVGHSFFGTMGNEGDFNRLGFSAGFEFMIPIGNRAARAIYDRAVLQELQAIVSYDALVETTAKEVKQASRALDVAWAQLYYARQSRLQFQKLLDKIEIQIRTGAEGIFSFEQVFIRLQDQQSLAGAEQSEHQALAQYNIAIVTLEKAKGTILRYDNVMMEQDPLALGQGLKYSDPRPAQFDLTNYAR